LRGHQIGDVRTPLGRQPIQSLQKIGGDAGLIQIVTAYPWIRGVHGNRAFYCHRNKTSIMTTFSDGQRTFGRSRTCFVADFKQSQYGSSNPPIHPILRDSNVSRRYQTEKCLPKWKKKSEGDGRISNEDAREKFSCLKACLSNSFLQHAPRWICPRWAVRTFQSNLLTLRRQFSLPAHAKNL